MPLPHVSPEDVATTPKLRAWASEWPQVAEAVIALTVAEYRYRDRPRRADGTCAPRVGDVVCADAGEDLGVVTQIRGRVRVVHCGRFLPLGDHWVLADDPVLLQGELARVTRVALAKHAGTVGRVAASPACVLPDATVALSAMAESMGDDDGDGRFDPRKREQQYLDSVLQGAAADDPCMPPELTVGAIAARQWGGVLLEDAEEEGRRLLAEARGSVPLASHLAACTLRPTVHQRRHLEQLRGVARGRSLEVYRIEGGRLAVTTPGDMVVVIPPRGDVVLATRDEAVVWEVAMGLAVPLPDE